MTIADTTNGKMDIDQLEMARNESAMPNSKSEEGLTPYFDPVLDKKTLFRLDILLVPLVASMYLLAFLDRANIGNARVAGLQKDLGISDTQYQIGKPPFFLNKDIWKASRTDTLVSNHRYLRAIYCG